jgi:hypothetical protein
MAINGLTQDAGVVETTAELEYSRKIVFFSRTGFDEAD